MGLESLLGKRTSRSLRVSLASMLLWLPLNFRCVPTPVTQDPRPIRPAVIQPRSREECQRVVDEYRLWSSNFTDSDVAMETLNESYNKSPVDALAFAAQIYAMQASGLISLVEAGEWIADGFDAIRFCDLGEVIEPIGQRWADVVLKDATDSRLWNTGENGLGKPDEKFAVMGDPDDFIYFGFTDVGAQRGPGNDIKVYFGPANGTAYVGLIGKILINNNSNEYVSRFLGGEQSFNLQPYSNSSFHIDLDDLPKFIGQLDEIVDGVYIGPVSGTVKIDSIEVLNPRNVNDLQVDSNTPPSMGDPYIDGLSDRFVTNDGVFNPLNAIGSPDRLYTTIPDRQHGVASYMFTNNNPIDGPGDDIIINVVDTLIGGYLTLDVSVYPRGKSGFSVHLPIRDEGDSQLGIDVSNLGLSSLGVTDIVLQSDQGGVRIDAIESKYNE